MIRTIASALALALLLGLRASAQGTPDSQPKDPKEEGAKEEGAKEEGSKEKADDAGDPAALKALQDGAELSNKKKYTFKGGLDVEVAGSPMFAVELNGEHAGKWTHFKTEAMGRQMEIFTDGETTLTLDPNSGEWKKQVAGEAGGGGGGGGGRGRGRGGFGGMGMDQVVKLVKSAKFDGEAKVTAKRKSARTSAAWSGPRRTAMRSASSWAAGGWAAAK
jgi:hypothetical protein